MKSFTVGFLGGPFDGRLQAVMSADRTRPPPVLETFESVPLSEPTVDLSVLAYRKVCYRLMVNRSGDGPLWLYVHPSVSLPRG